MEEKTPPDKDKDDTALNDGADLTQVPRPTSDVMQPTSDDMQPPSDVIQPNSEVTMLNTTISTSVAIDIEKNMENHSTEITSAPSDNPITPTKPLPLVSSAQLNDIATVASRKYRVLYEDMKKRLQELKKEHEAEMSEKEATINQLKKRLETPVVMKMDNEDIFVTKPKKGAKLVSTPECTVSGCEKTNLDLIKCNMCRKLVCDDCSGVKVSKLRPVMNQCGSLYFTCHTCSGLIREASNINVCDALNGKVQALTEELNSCEQENTKLTQQVRTLDDHQASLKILLEERETSLHESEAKLISMEQKAASSDSTSTRAASNLEELINQRFDNMDKNINAMIEHKLASVLGVPKSEAPMGGPPLNENANKLFSAVVGNMPNSTNHVAALKTSRNAEMIEKQEQEKRANNIVIHGISEERSTEVSIQDHDQQFITSLLQAIEVDAEPKQMIRLGNENADMKRPLKVIWKSAGDKNEVMSNLNKLKNADAALRGISVRDDYTIEERKLIKTLNEEAKRKNEAENVTHWKVRGTPKTA